jgi:Fe-S cluster biogenesis protein NfuA
MKAAEQTAGSNGAAANGATSAPAASAGSDAPSTTPVKITAQPSSTDPAVCRFTVEVPLFEERWIRIRNRDMAHLSPLAARLFEISQVVAVSFNGNVVLVTKSGPEPWPMIARQIGPAIRAHLASGQPAITSEPEELPKDSAQNLALFDRVKEVIETMINPGVAGHGGFVSLLGVEADTAYIQMGGGCHGCGMADVTLKQGIVQTIRSQVPEILQVLDTTDHAAGQNPYYSPS